MAVGADINALQRECDDGNGASYYELGVLYDNALNGAAQDYQKAAELYSKACELGNGGGCYLPQKSLRYGARACLRPI